MVRKIDWILQIAFITLLLLSLFDEWVIFFAGWFVLGCWQLFSAALNTNAFMKYGLNGRINKYWILSATSIFLVLLGGAVQLIPYFLYITGLVASPLLAIMYLIIYKTLINRMVLRHELSGFTKSKY